MENGIKNAFFISTISCTEQGIPVPLTHILLDTAYEYGFFTRSCDLKKPITVPHVAAVNGNREKYLKREKKPG